MKFVILGSGTSIPHPRRGASAYWLETANQSLLLDCSASAVHRMAQENLDWANLDAIWISHFHLDHVGGLPVFLFGTKYAPQTQDRRKKLQIFGPKGLEELIEKINRSNDYDLFKQPFPVEFIEVEPLEKFEILENAEAFAVKTPHTKESLAIRIRNENDETLVYTADTGFTEELAALARNADLLLMECSFFKNKPVDTHLELSEAMHIIRNAKPKKAVLTHLYPEWDKVDFQEESAKFSPPCQVIEAKDGLRFEII